MVFGKIKGLCYFPGYLVLTMLLSAHRLSILYADGVNVAASHPLISGTLAFGVGIFALKSTFSVHSFISLEFNLLGC